MKRAVQARPQLLVNHQASSADTHRRSSTVWRRFSEQQVHPLRGCGFIRNPFLCFLELRSQNCMTSASAGFIPSSDPRRSSSDAPRTSGLITWGRALWAQPVPTEFRAGRAGPTDRDTPHSESHPVSRSGTSGTDTAFFGGAQHECWAVRVAREVWDAVRSFLVVAATQQPGQPGESARLSQNTCNTKIHINHYAIAESI